MKCPKCSETIPANSNRCIYCGYVVTEEDRDAYIKTNDVNEYDYGCDILPPLKEVGASCSMTLMSQA